MNRYMHEMHERQRNHTGQPSSSILRRCRRTLAPCRPHGGQPREPNGWAAARYDRTSTGAAEPSRRDRQPRESNGAVCAITTREQWRDTTVRPSPLGATVPAAIARWRTFGRSMEVLRGLRFASGHPRNLTSWTLEKLSTGIFLTCSFKVPLEKYNTCNKSIILVFISIMCT